MHLQVGAVVIVRVDAEIARGAGHDLGETEGTNRGAGADGEPAFLPDEGLQEGAPLNRREAGTRHPCASTGLAGNANDELLDGLCGVPEHLGATRVGIGLARPIDGLCRAVGVAGSLLQIHDHCGQALATKICLRLKDALQGGELRLFNLGDACAHRLLLRLGGQIGLPIPGLKEISQGQCGVIRRHALRKGEGGQEQRDEDQGEPRRHCCPPARQAE